MNIEYYFKNCEDTEKESSRAYVETKRGQVEKIMTAQDNASAALEVKIERLVKKHAYKVTFMLRWPHEDLYAFEDDHTIVEAVDFAKDKLVDQIKKTYDRLRERSQPHHRSTGVKDWQMAEEWAEERPTMTIEVLKERITPLLGDLHRFLDRELGYYHMTGEVHPGEVRIDELIDDTFVTVALELRASRTVALEKTFFQKALAVLKERIEKLKHSRGSTVSLERELDKTPIDKKFETPIEEKSDIWQPDDNATFEQFVADERWVDPQAEQSRKELLKDVGTWLRVLPAAWRQILFLHVFQKFSLEKIAAIQSRTLEQVTKDFADAKKYLREQLQS